MHGNLTWLDPLSLCKTLWQAILCPLSEVGVAMQMWNTIRGKCLEGENIGEFGEFVVICQIFTLQMS